MRRRWAREAGRHRGVGQRGPQGGGAVLAHGASASDRQTATAASMRAHPPAGGASAPVVRERSGEQGEKVTGRGRVRVNYSLGFFFFAIGPMGLK